MSYRTLTLVPAGWDLLREALRAKEPLRFRKPRRLPFPKTLLHWVPKSDREQIQTGKRFSLLLDPDPFGQRCYVYQDTVWFPRVSGRVTYDAEREELVVKRLAYDYETASPSAVSTSRCVKDQPPPDDLSPLPPADTPEQRYRDALLRLDWETLARFDLDRLNPKQPVRGRLRAATPLALELSVALNFVSTGLAKLSPEDAARVKAAVADVMDRYPDPAELDTQAPLVVMRVPACGNQPLDEDDLARCLDFLRDPEGRPNPPCPDCRAVVQAFFARYPEKTRRWVGQRGLTKHVSVFHAPPWFEDKAKLKARFRDLPVSVSYLDGTVLVYAPTEADAQRVLKRLMELGALPSEPVVSQTFYV